jgi:hypothetical protein
MPSYAHYYQTLIPHMPVLPGSIHLHTHSPSVLTSLSGPQQQDGSGSLRARSWCWALSRRSHFPTNSFTWEELLTGLTTYLFQPQSPPSPEERSYTSSAQILLWPVCHAQFSTAWPQQPIGKKRHVLPKPVQQSQDDLTVLISEQGLHAQASSASPNNKDSSTQIQHMLPIQGMCTWVFSETNTDSMAPNMGVHGFFRTNTGFLSLYQNYTRNSYRLAHTDHPQDNRVESMRELPPIAYLIYFICMHQGGHLSPLDLHVFHQHVFLPPFGNSRVLSKGLRIKT